MRCVNTVLVILVIFAISKAGFAGDLDAPAAPTSKDSAMYTLENIYNRLNSNTQATKRAGGFTEPSGGPASTGRTLDEVYAKAIPTQVPKTGAGAIGGYTLDANEDGTLQKGVAWPSTHFKDNGDGTVTDNLTGLIWLQNPGCFGGGNWATALTRCNALCNGNCDLSDGSSAGEWRLPNVKELLSLIDYGQYDPPLPSGHPFEGVFSGYYWSSTTFKGDTNYAWAVGMWKGLVSSSHKGSNPYRVWPVRGGQ